MVQVSFSNPTRKGIRILSPEPEGRLLTHSCSGGGIFISYVYKRAVQKEWNTGMRIAVGMSGGVDSSVAALLLKREGHEVIGITMKIWKGNEVPGWEKGDVCYGPGEAEDIEAARTICSFLEISHFVVDCRDAYERIVLDNFRKEYRAGRTPNPCVCCNHAIKFGVLPDAARKMGISFEKFATGHYARILRDPLYNRPALQKGIEPRKDQSYFLYRLSQEQLAMSFFPLGGFRKEEVRARAKDAGLIVHDKKESQDFCHGGYGKILGIATAAGDIADSAGMVLGHHDGIWRYTIGQRKGLGIAWQEPLYVLRIDAVNNRIIVGTKKETLKSAFIVRDCLWNGLEEMARTFPAGVKIRSTTPEMEGVITLIDSVTAHVAFREPHASITPGQSAVFYRGDRVLGGGIIDMVET
jgi:tRNA-specific 2-thiouridylase